MANKPAAPDKELETVRDELARLHNQVTQLTGQRDRAEARADEAQQKLGVAEARAEGYSGQLKGRDKTIEALQDTCAILTEQLADIRGYCRALIEQAEIRDGVPAVPAVPAEPRRMALPEHARAESVARREFNKSYGDNPTPWWRA